MISDEDISQETVQKTAELITMTKSLMVNSQKEADAFYLHS